MQRHFFVAMLVHVVEKCLFCTLIMEKLLKEEEIQLLRSRIAEARNIVVCGHVSPDGDALGSTLSLYHWLRRIGKSVHVVLPNGYPEFLRWMPDANEIVIFAQQEEEARRVIAEADYMIICDLNQPSRMGDMEAAVMANDAPRILLDHHLYPEDFCEIVVSHPEMCAASEVVCHVLWQLGELDQVTTEEAACLYAGMMCDTGAFTFNSNRPVIYECISHLLARGIDKDRIYRNVFWTATPNRIRVTGYLLYVKMELLHDMHASIMTLTNEERKRFGIKSGDTEGIVNMPLQIQGQRLSIFLSEDTEVPGKIRVSLRSVDDFPCNEMSAQFFNGGGHKNASGGHLMCSIDEAVAVAKRAISKFSAMLKD